MSENKAQTDNKNTEEESITLPEQRILFGSPGTGKSAAIHGIRNQKDKVEEDGEWKQEGYVSSYKENNVFKTVFHPEYKYGDFMGRLTPTTKSGQVSYEYQAGHFMRALAQAYKNILGSKQSDKVEPVALVIDEINRGNSSAIFGTVFQLLDRDDDSWSSYDLDLSDIEKDCLLKNMGFKPNFDQHGNVTDYKDFKGITVNNNENLLYENNKIRIPPNLSIFATMNTSDESIYYMDSAFKRRWDWEFVPVDGELTKVEKDAFNNEEEWEKFVEKLNNFIKSNSKHIRKVEDKLIGPYFLKKPYSYNKIQSKLMFFLWDSVFSHDKSPLNTLLELEDDKSLVTFGDFANQVEKFVEKLKSLSD